MVAIKTVTTKSEKDTLRAGELFGAQLHAGDIVLLCGDLGSGKTVFTKGIAKGLGYARYEHITSPTFTIVHEIPLKPKLFHFDLYRLNVVEELYDIGFEEYCDPDNIVVIEWGDKFENYVPRVPIRINFAHHTLSERLISMEK